MKLRNYLMICLAAFATTFFLASCLNDDNKIPPNCYDGELNNGEQLIDCGGPCEECNHCINGIWDPNEGETCVDCGGECGECSQCANCVQDADEAGIDCGGTFCGPCADLCGDGLLNGTETEIDCGGDYCEACPTCTDGIMNGSEIGIDCGGAECPPCATDGNCTNGIIDGNEFWTDCGGSTCAGCDTILTFKLDGVTQTVIPDNITFSFASGTLNVEGTTLTGGVISFTIMTPAAGWIDGASTTIDELDQPDEAFGYLSESAVPYTTGFVNSTSTFNIGRFRSTPAPGFLRGSFTATLYNDSGSDGVSITNGLIQIPLN